MTCEHLESVTDDVALDSDRGCGDCLAAGVRWVHLRSCLECGHVACCDSSPMRHATAHFRTTGHPVVRSQEPGESWRWCYVDAEAAQPA